MKQYISKSALVAEIERRVELNDACQKISGGNEFYRGAIDEEKEILSFLDTLEAKEIGVDLGDQKGDKSAKYIIDTKTLEVKEMNLEEKATQLSQKYFPNEENIWARSNIEAQKCKSACIEMVEWLKAQKGE